MNIKQLIVSVINLTIITAQTAPIRCTAGQKCPESAPCCSELGFCGSDSVTCTLDCVPANSFSTNSCLNEDTCNDQKFDFKNISPDKKDRIQELAVFKLNKQANMDQVDFFTDGQTELTNDGLMLKMIKGSKGGSRMVSTAYFLYGNLTAQLKTGRTGGVVTSFITMSKVKDEIDFEWVGSEMEEVQTNVFYRGQADYINGGKSKVSSDTSQNIHTYTIEWTPNYIKWYVDNQLIRTLEKKDTAKNDKFSFPTTPSRIEFGLWNGASMADGTKQWAGGDINWDSEDIKTKGYFSATIENLEIKCNPEYKYFDQDGNKKDKSSNTNSKSSNNKSGNSGNGTSFSFMNSGNVFIILSCMMSIFIIN
ncbi:hypothetical protein K502DRAFT_363989 [Neoconidiobolus thromboides FSU 785]|nr:hypothetical protein K502DRAFT_363989 [Neoconidiobolus thromboides FSU 785]